MQHPHVRSSLDPSPNEIITIKRNARWAFDDFLVRWEAVINQNARRFRTSRNDHEDFCQIGRRALHLAVQTYVPGNARFASFATTLIRNAMLDERRKCMRRVEVTCTTAKDADGLLDAETVAYPDHLVEAEQTEMVEKWRAGLGERDGRIIKMMFDEAMTMTVVADNLGLSTARISQIISGLRQSVLKVA